MSWLYKGLGAMLAWFSSITGSYALALLFYALIFKLVFLPFSIKQQKNQIKMAKLAPKIEVIKAKYRGRTDQVTQRKMQEEILQLQQNEGYNPLSGCLPLLIQMPIIIFLYQVIRRPLSYIVKLEESVVVALNALVSDGAEIAFKSIDQITLIGKLEAYAAESGIAEISALGLDMSLIPNFNLWGMNLANTPSFTSLLVLIPFIAAAFQWLAMFVSRKMTGSSSGQPQTEDANAQMSLKMMDLMMPLMTLWFAFSFSAMMGLYWIYQSILGIIQTIILAKLMPVPKFTEEELKAMRKAEKTREKEQKAILKSQPKYRSLHYIDEDDYDELPEVKSADGKSASNKNISSDRPEIKD